MKRFASLFTSLIMAIWIGAIAILAIQNYTLVSLRFLVAQSFELPVGIVLAFSVAAGLVASAIGLALLGLASSPEDTLEDEV
jgi:uncharacterized integral membrane protein